MSSAAGADAGRGLSARAPGRLPFAPLLTAIELSGYGLRGATGGHQRSRLAAGGVVSRKKKGGLASPACGGGAGQADLRGQAIR